MSLFDWIEVSATIAMVVVLVLVFAITYWPGRKSKFEEHGRIPLKDDE